MDDLGSHSAQAVRRAIPSAGAQLFYVPKYSPDLNPIEQFFAKFKHWLDKAAQRTTVAVYDAIAPILDTVSPAECANYFANAGYDQTPLAPEVAKMKARSTLWLTEFSLGEWYFEDKVAIRARCLTP